MKEKVYVVINEYCGGEDDSIINYLLFHNRDNAEKKRREIEIQEYLNNVYQYGESNKNEKQISGSSNIYIDEIEFEDWG